MSGIPAWLAMYAARDRAFGVLSEAQWRVLIDMRMHGQPLPITSCCIASGAPATTALRHIGELVDAGFLERRAHPDDRRVGLMNLSAVAIKAFEAMEA